MTRTISNERGSALIITLMLLLILTAIGIFAISISTTEMSIALQSKVGTALLNSADSGANYGIDQVPSVYTDNVSRSLPDLSSYVMTSRATGALTTKSGFSANYRYADFEVTSVGTPPPNSSASGRSKPWSISVRFPSGRCIERGVAEARKRRIPMKTRISSIGLALLVSFLIALPATAPASDTELFTTSANPNVLLMLDISGSMNTVAGSSSVGDLDGEGTSNSRLDVLWKVVYTLLNADLSRPGYVVTNNVNVTCSLVKARRWNSTTIDQNISSSRRYQYVEVNNCAVTPSSTSPDPWSLFPGSTTSGGTVVIGSTTQHENMTYTQRSSATPYRFYFDNVAYPTGKSFSRGYNSGSKIAFSYDTTGSGLYPQIYPTNHTEAMSSDFLNNLTTADEEALKARLGLMTFSGSLPSTFRINTWNPISSTAPNAPPFSPTYRTLWSSVTSHAYIDSYTPTAKSLESSRSFFTTAYNPGTICRQNFAVLITDGEDTMGGLDGATSGTADYYSGSGTSGAFSSDGCSSWSGSGTSATCSSTNGQGQVGRHNAVIQEAAKLKTANPTVKLFTVGVGLAGEAADLRVQREVLRRAAEQDNAVGSVTEFNSVGASGDNTLRGAGRTFFATDAEELSTALRNVFHQITLGTYSFTSPTVATVRMTDRNYLYKASFSPAGNPETFWQGRLQAYMLREDGGMDPVWTGNTDNPDNSVTFPSTRRIFTASHSSPWASQVFDNSYITAGMLGVDNSSLMSVINAVRPQPDSAGRFGDIFHSKPVVVGPPSQFYFDSGYSTGYPVGSTSFVEAKKGRHRVVYVGTNDGMLHAIDAGRYHPATTTTAGYHDNGTGVEMFGYVPNNLLDKITNFVRTELSVHEDYVDSSPRVADVWIDGYVNGYAGLAFTSGDGVKQSSEWRTVLISGLRKGGNAYFALDVTDPPADAENPTSSELQNYPKVLWEYTDAGNVGQTWSEPFIGKVRVTSGSWTTDPIRDRWVAIFGGGVGGGTVGQSFVVLDIATGTALKTFTTGIDNIIPASPTAVLDANGYIRFAYVADLDGSVYKFDFRTTGTVGSFTEWSMKKIFQASSAQPVYHRVEPGAVNDATRYLYFGTGNQESPVSDGASGKFYAVKDTDDFWPSSPLTEANLANVTANLGYVSLVSGTTAPTQYGWYVNLGSIVNSGANAADNNTHAAEKVLSDPVVFYNNVYFTTYTPSTTDPCGGGGVARVYGVNWMNATAALSALPGRGETPASGKVAYHVYSDANLGGIPSSPSLSIYPSGQSSIFVGFSTGNLVEIKIESPPHYKTIKSWKEMF